MFTLNLKRSYLFCHGETYEKLQDVKVEQKRYIEAFDSSLYESYNLEFRHNWLFLNGLFKMLQRCIHQQLGGQAAAREVFSSNDETLKCSNSLAIFHSLLK